MANERDVKRFKGGFRGSRLLRFLASHLAFGVALGAAIAFVVYAANFAGMRQLIDQDTNPAVPLLLLVGGFTLTFGSLAMGIAVMTLPWGKFEDEDEQEADA